MAYRTTVARVLAVIKVGSDPKETDALLSGMRTANIMVTRVCVPRGYDETDSADVAILAEVETYLAAHLFSVFKPRREWEKAGLVAEKKITPQMGKGLDGTAHGQNAILLDVLGGLGALNASGGKVLTSITWLGTGPEDV